jgi:hypothetical protein
MTTNKVATWPADSRVFAVAHVGTDPEALVKWFAESLERSSP